MVRKSTFFALVFSLFFASCSTFNKVPVDRQVIPERLERKIVRDVNYILGKKWASEISEEDFNHAHICIPVDSSENSGEFSLINSGDISILYHTRELVSNRDKYRGTRNIYSRYRQNPALKKPQLPSYTVFPEDLGLEARFIIRFIPSEEGYNLVNGQEIDFKGAFWNGYSSPAVDFND